MLGIQSVSFALQKESLTAVKTGLSYLHYKALPHLLLLEQDTRGVRWRNPGIHVRSGWLYRCLAVVELWEDPTSCKAVSRPSPRPVLHKKLRLRPADTRLATTCTGIESKWARCTGTVGGWLQVIGACSKDGLTYRTYSRKKEWRECLILDI